MACTVGVCKRRVVKVSMSCSVFLTGLLRLTTGLLLPDRPTNGAVISAVIFFSINRPCTSLLKPFFDILRSECTCEWALDCLEKL